MTSRPLRTTFAITTALALAWMIWPVAVPAEGPPEAACLNCPPAADNRIRNPKPETGMWFDPAASGTGFMMEVQNDRLAGYYYLYDEDGQPLWYHFSGTLEAGEDGVMWVVDTGLQHFRDGACLHCPYQPPELVESPGDIHFEFVNRGKARFRVDDGPFQTIFPLIHGVSGGSIFAPHSDHLMPDLEGYWSLYFTSPVWGSSRNWTLGFTPEPAPAGITRYRLWHYMDFDDADHTRDFGMLECRVDEHPVCEVLFEEAGSPTHLSDRVFILRPADVTDSRLFAEEAESGWMFEAHRIDHD